VGKKVRDTSKLGVSECFGKKVRSGKFEFCFSYQVSKTFHDSKYRLNNSLDMYLSNKKYFVEKSSFFIEI
jgi:hypothetical protein